MFTVKFTNAERVAVIELVAREWVRAATNSAVPRMARIWNSPYPNIPGEKRKWFRAQDARAVLYRKILWSLGVKTPDIDAGSFVKLHVFEPSTTKYGRKGDLQFIHHARIEYETTLIAGLMASVELEAA